MTISPIDIQQHQFKTRLAGYEKTGVDHYLELIAEELERYHRQVQELKEELAHSRTALQELRQRESTVRETLMTARQVADEINTNARKEAEMCLAEAEMEAERIVAEAHARRSRLLNEIQEIRRQKVAFESGLRGIIEGHLRILDLDVLGLEEPSFAGESVTEIEAPSLKQGSDSEGTAER